MTTGAEQRGPSLHQLQRWLQAVITHPAGIVAGIAAAPSQSGIDVSAANVEELIQPSRSQTSVERLAVYGNAYYLRLLDCLRELFPCLADALGRETFDQFAAGYLQKHPPESYTLKRLADRFAQFLEETRPGSDAPWAGFVVDLARLESAIDQVFDDPGPEPDPWNEEAAPQSPGAVSLSQLAPWELTGETRLLAAPGLKLLAFGWPVSTYYTDWKQDRQPDWPEPREQFVALLRRDYIVRRHELTRPMFELLSLLVAGTSVGDAIGRLLARDESIDLSPPTLQDWFYQWTRNQFFVSAKR